MALAYRSAETSPSSALISQRGTLRLAVFALVAAECTLHYLSSSRNAPRKNMGVSASDFDIALISAWGHVSETDTDGLFEDTQSALPLGRYDRLRALSGLTSYQARIRKLTHHALQMAVARSLLIRAIHRMASVFKAHADDAPRGSVRTSSEKLFSCLREELGAVKGEIRRARSILELMGAKDSWPVIRATYALCHVASPPGFAVDDLSSTFPLDFMSIGRTPKGMAAAIKNAVARAGSARELGVAGGLGSDLERQSQAALRDKTGPAATPVSTASKQVQAQKRPRVLASDLRGALRPLMLSMRAAGKELSAMNVQDALSSIPNIQVGNQGPTTTIERFNLRLVNAGTSRGATYDFVIHGNPFSCTRGAFNNTVYILKKAITKDESQPG
ncbi:MAG: hypothetical protein ABI702_20955 [Burkholderiales bacterium]